jgi:hypothetical protein
MKAEISAAYTKFFKDLDINQQTGLINGSHLKFATYPYIGTNYELSIRKILFVGLDIGRDETLGYVQGFDERRRNIAKETHFNPHIAGTYITSLYFLKEIYGWNDVWDKIKIYGTSQRATKTKNHSDNQNPLHYIALTNYYKFVNDKRVNRSGDINRIYYSANDERDLFISEIKILKPHVIIFQGNLPINEVINKLKATCLEIYKAKHPSNRQRGGRQPETYISSIIKL